MEANEIKVRLAAAIETCITCGSPVGIYCADEGTHSYVPFLRKDIARLIEELEKVQQELSGISGRLGGES